MTSREGYDAPGPPANSQQLEGNLTESQTATILADGEWDQELMAVEKNDNIESANQGHWKRKASKDYIYSDKVMSFLDSTSSSLLSPVGRPDKYHGYQHYHS
jgi:hypothetical protein